jgi:hypothetical protein
VRGHELHHALRELRERLDWMRYEMNETTDQVSRLIEDLKRSS